MQTVLPRGVHRCPFFSTSGDPVLMAINSKGRYCGWLTYDNEDTEDAAREALWTLLDRADPVPVKLVG